MTSAEVIAQARQHAARGDLGEAARLFDLLLQQDAANPAVILAVAAFEAGQGGVSHAIARLRAATAANPTSPSMFFYLGTLFHYVGDREAARTALEAGLRLHPAGSAPVFGILASAAVDDGRYDDAFALLARLFEHTPDDVQAINILGAAHTAVGDLASARTAFERVAASSHPTASHALSNLASLAMYDDASAPADTFITYQRWAERQRSITSRLSPRTERRPGRVRVGFVSNDFRSHSVAGFFTPLITNLDRAQAEVTCYASVPRPDGVTATIRGLVERWVDIAASDDVQAAEQIWNDDIDLLIDLGGHTAHHRLAVFAARPARVQATWLGYPNTTGLPEIDFRITDAIADPFLDGDPAQHWHSERLIRLEGPFFCYAGPGDLVAPIGPASSDAALSPAGVAGHVTFGVATNISKLRPAMVRLYARLMRAVPGSRIQIVASACSANVAQAWIKEIFAEEIIAADRVDLLGKLPFAAFLNLHKTWDVALDTFPTGGHTTTCHAMWMGTPLVTLAGQTHASRLGASTLHHAGLDELVAHSPAEFVEIARALVHDSQRLRALRVSLHGRFAASPAMDGVAFARNFERAIAQMTSGIR